MLAWLSANIGTILICAALLALVAAILAGLRRDRKAGKSSCGCGCAGCAMCGQCHGRNAEEDDHAFAVKKEVSAHDL
ncbi:MAG: FeoB-associated Cys-rich membrane protein [Firmicutes bacterium]|nr:FeoB-associated Cys-rich membrane protein [Bacillota bacterium]